MYKGEVRLSANWLPLTPQVPAAVLEQEVPTNVRVFGNCTMIILPKTRLLMVVNFIVPPTILFMMLLLIVTTASVIIPAVAVIVCVPVSMAYTEPLTLVTVVNTMVAARTEGG